MADDEPPRRNGNIQSKTVVTVVGCGLIIFLVVAGSIAKDINYTAVALALVSLLGLLWGDPLNRKDDK